MTPFETKQEETVARHHHEKSTNAITGRARPTGTGSSGSKKASNTSKSGPVTSNMPKPKPDNVCGTCHAQRAANGSCNC